MKKALFAFLAVLFVLSACQSGPVDIPEDMPPNKIIQKAQEASDRNRYKIALQYYEALKERYGDTNEYLCAAEYEIAFIHYKQKKYDEARGEFQSLLARYDGVDGQLLPPHYKILSEKVLSKITQLDV